MTPRQNLITTTFHGKSCVPSVLRFLDERGRHSLRVWDNGHLIERTNPCIIKNPKQLGQSIREKPLPKRCFPSQHR